MKMHFANFLSLTIAAIVPTLAATDATNENIEVLPILPQETNKIYADSEPGLYLPPQVLSRCCDLEQR